MVGIFCTTEPEKIRGAIRSRCEEHRIRKITREDIAARMRKILAAEGVAFEDDALLTVIDSSGGHVRDILTRLEMIAQQGTISTEAVRAYLGLGLVTTYYDILLHLDDPSAAIGLIEAACDQVGPEEVSVGLAEASMNAYRLAHKMFAEFTYVDRGKATELYAKLGDSTVGYAKRFLGSQARTKVGLICDVIAVTTAVEIPVVQIPVAKVQSQVVQSPAPALASPPPPVPDAGPDRMALTSVDPYGRGSFPRGHEDGVKKVVTATKEVKAVPPADWKRSFERSWKG